MNPIIRHKYSCDPTAIVVDETVYLYTGHDEAPPGVDDYRMNRWLLFSSKDLVNWMILPGPVEMRMPQRL